MTDQGFEEEKYEDAYGRAYDEQHAEFDNIRKQKLIISLVGGVNAGKSKTINALTGIDYAEVKARAGCTKNITLYELSPGVFVADTPGLHDVNEEVSDKSSDFVEQDSDIVLFFLNAAVGVNKHEKEAFEKIAQLGKDIIVVLNKIDVHYGDDFEESLADIMQQTQEELGVTPIPISSKDGTGVQDLNDAILDILVEKGKDLLFLKVSRHKEKSVAKWINSATAAAAAIGAIPVPGSDIVPLTSLQVGLAMKIAYIYDIKPSKNDVMKLVGATVTGSIGKQIARFAITALKAVGWIPGGQFLEAATMAIAASVAASMTYAFGWACNAYYKSGMTLDLGDVADIFEESYEDYRQKAKA